MRWSNFKLQTWRPGGPANFPVGRSSVARWPERCCESRGRSSASAAPRETFSTANICSLTSVDSLKVRSLATATESYSIDNNHYPAFPVASAQGLDALIRLLEPTYGKELVRVDGWGTPLTFQSTKGEYTITALGADRLPDTVSSPGKVAPNGGTTSFNADVLFCTGSFVQFPDGTMT